VNPKIYAILRGSLENGGERDLFLVRPVDLLRKMFDELTNGLHWLVYSTVYSKPPLYFSNTMHFTRQDLALDAYGLPLLANENSTVVFSSAKLVTFDGQTHTPLDSSAFDLCLGTWDCDKLLQHIFKSKKEGAQSRDGDWYPKIVRRKAKELFLIRHALFHRSWLHVPGYERLILKNISFIAAKMDDLLQVDSLDQGTKSKVQHHQSNITRLQNVALALQNFMECPDVAGITTAKLQHLHKQSSDSPDLQKFLICSFGSRFAHGVDDALDAQAAVSGPTGAVSPKFALSEAKRYRSDEEHSFSVLDPFSVTNIDLVNRCLDELADFLFSLVDATPNLKYPFFQCYCVYTEFTPFNRQVFIARLQATQAQQGFAVNSDVLSTELHVLARAKGNVPPFPASDQNLMRLLGHDPFSLLELFEGITVGTVRDRLARVIRVRHLLAHQVYILEPQRVKIIDPNRRNAPSLWTFFVDIANIVQYLATSPGLVQDEVVVLSESARAAQARLDYLCSEETLRNYTHFKRRQFYLVKIRNAPERAFAAAVEQNRLLLETLLTSPVHKRNLDVLQSVAIGLDFVKPSKEAQKIEKNEDSVLLNPAYNKFSALYELGDPSGSDE